MQQLIFFFNGQTYFENNFPCEGLDELNTWIATENNRRDWGSYTFTNGEGTLKMPYDNIPLQMKNDKLVVTTKRTDHSFIN